MNETALRCNRCFNVWYVDMDEVHRMHNRDQWDRALGGLSAVSALFGDRQAQRDVQYYSTRRHMTELEVNELSRCPRCRSSDFTRMPSGHSSFLTNDIYNSSLPAAMPEPNPMPTPKLDLSSLAGSLPAQSSSSGNASAVTADDNTTPAGVMIIASFSGLFGVTLAMAVLLMVAITAMHGFSTGDTTTLMYMSVSLFFSTLFSVLFIAVAHGLWKRKNWARIAAMIYACISLAGFPVGTAIGAAMLWYLNQHDIKRRFA